MTVNQAARAIAALATARQSTPTTQPPATWPTWPPTSSTPTTQPPEDPDPPLQPGAAFQAVYALAADQTAAAGMVAAIQHELGVVSDWFASQTSGVRPRFVRSGPSISVVAVQLTKTRAQLESAGSTHDMLESELKAAGVPGANRVAVVYLDISGPACGMTGGHVGLYMATCTIYPESGSTWPYNATYLAAHEMTHALGAVSSCAPHHGGGGHVTDDPRDVLYYGASPRDWNNLILDPGHDDYYALASAVCTDIADSHLWDS